MEEKINYFILRTDERLLEMDQKLDRVLALKFMILGGSAVVSFLVTFVVILFEAANK